MRQFRVRDGEENGGRGCVGGGCGKDKSCGCVELVRTEEVVLTRRSWGWWRRKEEMMVGVGE